MATGGKRIFFAGGGTGGHLYPGLAIARAIVKIDPAVKPFFVGAKRGIERDVLPQSEFEHELLDLHPLYRTRVWRNAQTASGGLAAWSRIRALARQHSPLGVVGTGGYASGLMLGFAWLNRIPFAVQEQNSYPGLTTRFFARHAGQVHLGFPEARDYLKPGRNTHVFDSGNPIDPPPDPLPDKMAARDQWGFPKDEKPVLLVFGGSQGAHAINEAVAGCLNNGLADHVHLLWVTGKGSYDRYSALGSGSSHSVKILPYASPMSDAYAATDFVVARAGAMSCAELSAWGIPAIFIPLPTAAADHQTSNAKALVEAGAGRLLVQRNLTSESLAAEIQTLANDPDMLAIMSKAALRRSRAHAAQVIAEQILSMVTSSDR